MRAFVDRVEAELRAFVAPLKPVPATVFLVSALVLCLHYYYGQGKFFRRVLGPALGFERGDIDYYACLYWQITSIPLYFVIPWLSLRLAGRFDRDEGPVWTEGLGLGDWRFGIKCAALFYAVMVPLLAVIMWSGDFQEKYPLCDGADTLPRFVVYEIGFAIYFMTWEYLFRGYMLFGLKRTFGSWAVWIQMLPFVIAHFPKPDLESLSSIIGGLALGWLALRTRSIWYGWFVHAATAITLECLMVALKGGFPAA